VYFQHSAQLWRDFPALVPVVLYAEGITPDVSVADGVARYWATARTSPTESELPQIQAWRRAFASMGMKPTQYRCASEALLRRFRKEGSLPALHPLVDLCNAISIACAVPIAAIDLGAISGDLEVRYATGEEKYLTFAGDVEQPSPGEVIFADAAGNAHARRWTNRQSGLSAVRDSTSTVLIVAEALHPTAAEDMPRLLATLTSEIAAVWQTDPVGAILAQATPRFQAGRLSCAYGPGFRPARLAVMIVDHKLRRSGHSGPRSWKTRSGQHHRPLASWG
jgi:DNA/RNA-binding domain of Phe-tRNA-synthetase-like protein